MYIQNNYISSLDYISEVCIEKLFVIINTQKRKKTKRMIVYFGREENKKKLLTIILLFDIRCIVDLLIKPSLSTSTTTKREQATFNQTNTTITINSFDSIRFFVSVVVVFLFFTPSTLNKTNKLTTTEKKTTLNGGNKKI